MAPSDALTRGRQAFARQQWREAYAQLSAAAEASAPEADDLDRLATAAYLVGEDGEALAVWRRAYETDVERGAPTRAARWGFWVAFHSMLKGELAQSSGWLARTQRLLGDRPVACVEQGYVCVLLGLLSLGKGDAAGARSHFEQVADVAGRFGDADLASFGLIGRGEALVASERTSEAVALLDEAMIEVTSGKVSPIVAGIVYCAVILACNGLFDVRRAREWTNALDEWCASQPDLVPFRGRCLVHRAEVMQLQGAWAAALQEATRACELLAAQAERSVGHAYYQRAELHRLRGELELAEQMYGEAGRHDYEPQPGMSLLRLAQGRLDAAEAAIRRVVDEGRGDAGAGKPRPDVLGAHVEIMLERGDVPAARTAADELDAIAADRDAPLLHALAARARGAVRVAEGDAKAGLVALREAWTLWQQIGAPYESARVRVLLAAACEQLGDHDTAHIHLDGARSVFERLGAAPDLARLAHGAKQGATGSEEAAPATDASVGLTARERQVLGLVASGKTNRQIAAELVISEHTVARHVSNIFNKIGVTSRTAASAFAFAHDLVRR